MALLRSLTMNEAIQALGAQRIRLRRKGAKALVRIGDSGAVNALIAALGDEDAVVRRAASVALGRIGDARAVEPLIAAVNRDAGITESAGEALGKIGDPRAVQPLIAAQKRYRVDAPLDKESSYHGVFLIPALVKIGPGGVPALTTALEDEDPIVREIAANVLTAVGDCRAVESWLAALADEYWKIRAMAARGLGEVREPRAIGPLISAMKDSPMVREPLGWKSDRDRLNQATFLASAQWALTRLGAPVVEPLITAMKDETNFFRSLAGRVLSSITGKKFLRGNDSPEKWQKWWQDNRDTLRKDA